VGSRRVIFLGEKPLGLRCLQFLEGLPGVELVGVCTRARREVWWGSHEVRDYCEAKGIPILPRSAMGERRVDFLFSVLYPLVVEGQYLQHVGSGAFNLHEAPLPRWRGCNGYSHAILANDDEYGTTLHQMVADLDSGGIVAERRCLILPHETSRELYERTTRESELLVRQWLPRVLDGDYRLRFPAPEEESFLNPRDSLLGLKQVDLNSPLEDVLRTVRALDFVPWEPAFVEAQGQRFYLFLADAHGREGTGLPQPVPIPRVSSLAEVKWSSLVLGVIRGLPRPLVVCTSDVYKRHFSLFGQLAVSRRAA